MSTLPPYTHHFELYWVTPKKDFRQLRKQIGILGKSAIQTESFTIANLSFKEQKF